MYRARPLVVMIVCALVVALAGNLPAGAQEDMATPIARSPSPVELVWETTGGSEPFDMPFDVAIDPAGNLWVSDGRNSRFQIFAPDGTFLEAWGTPGNGEGEFTFTRKRDGQGFGGVAFDADGNIYVVDTGNFRAQKFDAERHFVKAWGSEGEGDGQFRDPLGIAVSPDGLIYVIDDDRDDVQVFDADGAFRLKFAGFGVDPGKMLDAGTSIAFDGDGNVLVSDFGNQRVQRFAPDGTFLDAWGSFGTDEGKFVNPNGLAVDGEGRVYVTDVGNHRVQVFAAEGEFLFFIDGEDLGDAPDFITPADIAVAADGTIYVSDAGSNVVRAFRPV